eukprot:2900955-Amphidinium_carterae.1
MDYQMNSKLASDELKASALSSFPLVNLWVGHECWPFNGCNSFGHCGASVRSSRSQCSPSKILASSPFGWERVCLLVATQEKTMDATVVSALSATVASCGTAAPVPQKDESKEIWPTL